MLIRLIHLQCWGVTLASGSLEWVTLESPGYRPRPAECQADRRVERTMWDDHEVQRVCLCACLEGRHSLVHQCFIKATYVLQACCSVWIPGFLALSTRSFDEHLISVGFSHTIGVPLPLTSPYELVVDSPSQQMIGACYEAIFTS